MPARVTEAGETRYVAEGLALTVRLLGQPKFRLLRPARYPALFIDEYQDTDMDFVDALREHFLAKERMRLEAELKRLDSDVPDETLDAWGRKTMRQTGNH